MFVAAPSYKVYVTQGNDLFLTRNNVLIEVLLSTDIRKGTPNKWSVHKILKPRFSQLLLKLTLCYVRSHDDDIIGVATTEIALELVLHVTTSGRVSFKLKLKLKSCQDIRKAKKFVGVLS
jgi:hypothetical protein